MPPANQRQRLHSRPQRQQTNALWTQQPLVSRHGDHVRVQHVQPHIQYARRLRRVHQQRYAVFFADSPQTVHGCTTPVTLLAWLMTASAVRGPMAA